MSIETVVGLPINFIIQVGQIGLWLKAVGLIFVIDLVFEIVNFFIARRRNKDILKIKEDIKRIERKIDKVLKKR